MNLTTLTDRRKRYESCAIYFRNIGFNVLATDYADMVKIIDGYMEETGVTVDANPCEADGTVSPLDKENNPQNEDETNTYERTDSNQSNV